MSDARSPTDDHRSSADDVHLAAGSRPAGRRRNRRWFLSVSASSSLAVVTAACAPASPPPAQPETRPSGQTGAAGQAPVHETLSEGPSGPSGSSDGFTALTLFQAGIVRAAAARIIPTDDNGPGATEAGVVSFIDRHLASESGAAGRRYAQGPFAKGGPTQGDQSGLAGRDRYRLGLDGMERYARRLYGQGFADLGPSEQDRILTDMEAGRAGGFEGIDPRAFFELLRFHAIAGFFADPVRGGNRDMAGWKLIGFPGAQMGYSSWIGRHGVPFDGPYRSVAEHHHLSTHGG